MASPFNLQIGSSVLASIVSYNQVGDSPYSDVGNGAMIQLSLVPDAPLNLTRSNATLNSTRISLNWQNGANNGNQPVLDYTLLALNQSGAWNVIESGIRTRSYTVERLTTGITYTFTVQARNLVGLSISS